MDDALKNKVMVGVLVALVGLVVWWNLPAGTPEEEDYEEEVRWVRKTAEVEQQDEMVEKRRREVEEENDMAPIRRKTTDIDEPIRRRSKKPTAKEEIVPAV